MVIKSPTNLFPGVNPLLNSFLQRDAGEWESFHAELVVQTRIALDEQLPEGYLALAEKSLQISTFTPSDSSIQRTRPDVTVYQTESSHKMPVTSPHSTATPTITLPLLETIEETDPLTAVVIYQQSDAHPLGQPVTRLEMLSPANKPGGSHFPRYRQRREETLHTGLRLVEVDYLHETPPVIANMPSYRDGDSDAYPYHIMVSDPHPTFSEGEVYIYGFGVLDPIPTVSIPLADSDKLPFDFGDVYNRVFESLRFCAVVVDYDELPVIADRYLPSDVSAIEQKLSDIRAQHS